MATPILTTKLYAPPPRAELVTRPRLIDRLNRGLRRAPGVSLVCAPAGFGKTTLVSYWLRQVNRPVAWLSLDEGDNDPNRFLNYFIAALRQIFPQIEPSTHSMYPAPPLQNEQLETVLTLLINEIAGTTGQFVLVLDDYHEITTAAIHQLLTFWLDYLPPQLHVVIISRVDPPLPVARLRGRGQLTEVRAADLRFALEEAADFLNRLMGLNLAADDVAALAQRTEGWVVGLQLAAYSMQENPNRSKFVARFTGDDRYVTDYLVDEVFSRQPQLVQEFLLRTSILGRLNGSLCDAVLNSAGSVQPAGQFATSQAILEYLEQSNLFIIPLDNQRRWYRHHQLFADLLRHRLQQTRPELLPELHRRAAEWHEAQDFNSEALHHFLAAKDFLRAAPLIESIGAIVYWQHGEFNTLLGWLNQLPRPLVYSRPKLCLLYAEVLYLAGQFDALEPFLNAAEAALQPGGNAPATPEGEFLLGEVLAIRVLAAGVQGDTSRAVQAIELAFRALKLLPTEEHRLRALLTLGLAEAYYLNGQMDTAAHTYQTASELALAGDNLFLALASLFRLTHVFIIKGQLNNSAAVCAAIQRLIDERPMPIALATNIHLADLQRERNQLDTAEQQLQAAFAAEQQQWTNPRIAIEANLTLGRTRQAKGDFAGAAQAFQVAAQVEFQHQTTSAWDLPPIEPYRARLELARGNLAAADRWLAEQKLQPTDPLNHLNAVDYFTLARALLARGQTASAQTLLERLRQSAVADGRGLHQIEALALLALAHHAAGRPSEAFAALEQALNLAAPEGFVRIFLDEGQPALTLLAAFCQSPAAGGPAAAYARCLLTEAGAVALPVSSPAEKPAAKSQNLVEPLTSREIEVLQLIAGGFTNHEIAARLVLTTGTVKLHAHNIYGKLGVNSRTQAIARATALGLLSPETEI